MRRCFIISLFLIGALFLVPWLCTPGVKQEELPPEEEQSGEKEPEAVQPEKLDALQLLRVKRGDKIETMTMETYLRGVLRAEMPASFHQEALKAQTVAARTYVLHKTYGGAPASHPEADVCDDIGCCQAFKEEREAAADWGAMTLQYEEKIRAAVSATDGQVVIYDEKPVLAVFHSSSSGATRNAEEVWSSSVPYLKSVASPENGELVPNYYGQAGFTPEEFKLLFLSSYPDAALGGDPLNWFSNIQQEETGTVASLQVGGVPLTGVELRKILGLRSAAFTISFEKGEIVFSTTGYGHGVGMSQYGANYMASQGETYDKILTTYYTGVKICDMNE